MYIEYAYEYVYVHFSNLSWTNTVVQGVENVNAPITFRIMMI